MLNTVLASIQLFFSFVIGIYFFTQLRAQQSGRNAIESESKRELEKLNKMKEIHLTMPLSEKTRPSVLSEIVGQEQGIKALKASLCGPNPQHVIIYGPPGVGKTAAARIILDYAKKNPVSPFGMGAKFIETDATTMQFDERNIADPLIGSVHDPIYQGAGAYGQAGIPQPKAGAVSKAHGGVLFIDEIGELHPIQLNRLLKVLEDRKVMFESSYYSSDDKNIPPHIHKIFKEGLPADFRLVGATTRSPEDIPPAIRSRCVEIYFKPLNEDSVKAISNNASKRGGFEMEEGSDELISHYAENGRDAVNIVQIAGSVALSEGRRNIKRCDVEWVIEFGKYSPHIEKKVSEFSQVGVVNGLAVSGHGNGLVMEIEATAVKCDIGKGNMTVTGIIESEELDGRGQRLKRASTAKNAVENIKTVFKNMFSLNLEDYNVHINFPGGMPVDGPSAGISMLCAVYSAITGVPFPKDFAMTGEISILGKVKPVGGVVSKVEAAQKAGAKTVIIPKSNYQEIFEGMDIDVIGVDDISEVINLCFDENKIPDIQPMKHKSESIMPTVKVNAEGK